MPRFRNLTKQVINLTHPTNGKTATINRTLIEDQPDGTRAVREETRAVPCSETWEPLGDREVSVAFANSAACLSAVRNKQLRKIAD